ncbi:MAG: HEPN domain-containing protein [Nitrospirota bacterium]
MNEDVVKKWMLKADNDLKIGKDEQATIEPVADMVCFHMQQCVEKYLKAFLVFHGKEINKTHNISLLIRQCMEIDADFGNLSEDDLESLVDYVVEVRYPDDFYMPSSLEAEKAIEIAEFVKRFVREKIRLEDGSIAMNKK